MGQRIIDLLISPGGETKIETVCGHGGATCTEATKFLEAAIGVVEQEDLKPEYYAGDDVPREHVHQ